MRILEEAKNLAQNKYGPMDRHDVLKESGVAIAAALVEACELLDDVYLESPVDEEDVAEFLKRVESEDETS